MRTTATSAWSNCRQRGVGGTKENVAWRAPFQHRLHLPPHSASLPSTSTGCPAGSRRTSSTTRHAPPCRGRGAGCGRLVAVLRPTRDRRHRGGAFEGPALPLPLNERVHPPPRPRSTPAWTEKSRDSFVPPPRTLRLTPLPPLLAARCSPHVRSTAGTVASQPVRSSCSAALIKPYPGQACTLCPRRCLSPLFFLELTYT